MKPWLRRAIFAVLVGGAGCWLWPQSARRHPPGVLIAAEPVQRLIAAQPLGDVHGFQLTAVATYAIQARVLRTKRSWADTADLVPYDVALGWGPMSDQAVLDRLDVSHGNRFFFTSGKMSRRFRKGRSPVMRRTTTSSPPTRRLPESFANCAPGRWSSCAAISSMRPRRMASAGRLR